MATVKVFRCGELTVEIVDEPTDPGELATLEQVERLHVRRVLAAVGGNKSKAAKVLGIDRRSLYRRLEADGATAEPEPEALPLEPGHEPPPCA